MTDRREDALLRQLAQGTGALRERALQAAETHGRRKIADLVYEMGFSCLVSDGRYRELTEVTKEPDTVQSLQGQRQIVEKRLPGNPPTIGGLPKAQPAPESALAMGIRCADVLEELEGQTVRWHLLRCQICFEHDPPASQEAANHAREALAASPREEWADVARKDLLRALAQLGEWEEMQSLASSALARDPDDRFLLLDLAIARAGLKDRGGFADAATKFAGVNSRAPAADWWWGVARRLSPQLSADLGTDLDFVQTKLGLQSRDEESSV